MQIDVLQEVRRRRRAREDEGGEGWWDACTELRKRHDVAAREALERHVRRGTLNEQGIAEVVHHASRDLSRKTNIEVGGRYGQTFAMQLGNMAWTRDQRAPAMAAALRTLLHGGCTLDDVLKRQPELSTFVFATLAGYLLWPERYLPWIRAVHDGAGSLRPNEEALTRKPNEADYAKFIGATRELLEGMDCQPCMVDQLLYKV
ncbi:MAG: hypothetical protein ACI8PZ_002132 [Myxococcota bacterium]|jgi:hypothetical protein